MTIGRLLLICAVGLAAWAILGVTIAALVWVGWSLAWLVH